MQVLGIFHYLERVELMAEALRVLAVKNNERDRQYEQAVLTTELLRVLS